MPRRGENVFKRKDGLWEARYIKEIDPLGKKKYGSVYARSYKEVKAKREAVVMQLTLLPKANFKYNMTLNALIEEWLVLNKNRLKRSSYQKYTSIYKKHIQEDIGTINTCRLSTLIIQNFTNNKLEAGLSASTINSILIFLHTCLKYGNKQYHIPMVDIIYLKNSKKQMRVLSIREQEKLVLHLTKEPDIFKLGTLVALYTGLRIGELCALTWGDIKEDFITVSFTVQRGKRNDNAKTEIFLDLPKTASSNRKIPIPSFLKEMIEKQRLSDSKHFLSTQKHKIIEPRLLQYHFKKYIKQIELPKTNFHALRHTFATRCIEKGCDVKTLSEILGHSNVATTMNLYVHSSDELKKASVERLDFFL